MEAKRYHFEHLIQTLATFGNERARESVSLSSIPPARKSLTRENNSAEGSRRVKESPIEIVESLPL